MCVCLSLHSLKQLFDPVCESPGLSEPLTRQSIHSCGCTSRSDQPTRLITEVSDVYAHPCLLQDIHQHLFYSHVITFKVIYKLTKGLGLAVLVILWLDINMSWVVGLFLTRSRSNVLKALQPLFICFMKYFKTALG